VALYWSLFHDQFPGDNLCIKVSITTK
jgi:hypothetical protein